MAVVKRFVDKAFERRNLGSHEERQRSFELETRYGYVARTLASSIASGEHPAGTVLPTEVDLAKQFQVSRATVRAALRELQQLGLVSRRRNVGTTVEASRLPHESAGYIQSLDTVDDVFQYADDTSRCIQEIASEVADDALAMRLSCRPGRRWIRVSSLRVRDNQEKADPICWTDVYIDDLYADIIRANVEHYTGAIGSLVEEQTGRRIAQMVQEIRSTGIPSRIVSALKAQEDSHALEITRRYIDASGGCFIVSISVHPANRFIYAMRLRRSTPS